MLSYIAITEGLVDRLIALGKRFDYFVYPNRDHGLSEGLVINHISTLPANTAFE